MKESLVRGAVHSPFASLHSYRSSLLGRFHPANGNLRWFSYLWEQSGHHTNAQATVGSTTAAHTFPPW